MKRRTAFSMVLLVVVLGAAYWWKTHRGDARATGTATDLRRRTDRRARDRMRAGERDPRRRPGAPDDHGDRRQGSGAQGPAADRAARRRRRRGRDRAGRRSTAPRRSSSRPASGRSARSAKGHAPAAVDTAIGPGETASSLDRAAARRSESCRARSPTQRAGRSPARGSTPRSSARWRDDRCASRSTLTGADGKYKLTVAEGQLLVAASERGATRRSRGYVEVGAGGATADFALVPGGVIEGIVRDEKTQQPVAGARSSRSATRRR